MKAETKIFLNRFQPREYQIPLVNALERRGYKRLLAVWPRRAGKDLIAWNLMVRAAIRTPGSYIYCLPEFAQCRRVLLDSKLNDGKSFLDFIPEELVYRFNQQQMKITLINGSVISMMGSNSYNTIVGANALGIVVSEAALADPLGISYLRPIITVNDGWMLIISTPRGYNHLWETYNVAKQSNKWFLSYLTVDDTQHVTREQIQQDVEDGLVSKNLVMQEYWCSFSYGAEGAFYSKYMDKMRLNNQICDVPWVPELPVHTFWDLGRNDANAIIFAQFTAETIRIIDYYEDNTLGMEDYIKYVKTKDYMYGRHIAPHDINVKDYSGEMSRRNKAHYLGIDFIVAPNVPILEGIEATRTILPRTWMDKIKCAELIKHLDNYTKQYDDVRKRFREVPYKDYHTHGCDAMRYLALTQAQLRGGTSADEIDRRYEETRHGSQGDLPPFFRDIHH